MTIKRICLTNFWPGDIVYHVIDGDRGLVITVALATERLVPRYYVVFGEHKGEWCDEMELSGEKNFNTIGDAKV